MKERYAIDKAYVLVGYNSMGPEKGQCLSKQDNVHK